MATTTLVCTPAAWAGLAEGVDALDRDDYATALKELAPLADSGQPVAQQKLGWMYKNGAGVAKDPARALSLLSSAAANGNARAQALLGHMHANGEGVPANLPEARRFLLLSAGQGDDFAMALLGEILLRGGPGLSAQPNEGERWLRAAIRKGRVDAHVLLARVLEAGDFGLERDPKEARRLIQAAAATGDEDGRAALAEAYVSGLAGTKDLVLALALSLVPPVIKGNDTLDELAESMLDAARAEAQELAKTLAPPAKLLESVAAYQRRRDQRNRERAQAQVARFRISADAQEVTDLDTELTWRRCPEGMRVDQGRCADKPLELSFPQAAERAQAEARRTGKPWELPQGMSDLRTLWDIGFTPPFNPQVFPPVEGAGSYWTRATLGPMAPGTHHVFQADEARFREALAGSQEDGNRHWVRLVRHAP